MDKRDLIERLQILNAGLGNVVPKHTKAVNDAIAYIETAPVAEVPCSGVLSRMPHTKDGKIILWEDKVYFPDPDKMIMDRELDIIEGVVEAITIGVQFKEYEGTHTVMFGEYESGNLELYSSRELVPLEPGFEEE